MSDLRHASPRPASGTTRSTLGGVVHAAWTSLKPSGFVPRRPTRTGVRYRSARARGIAPLVDIYVPDTPAPPTGYPSVLVLHGGAFLVGSRQMRAVRFLATRLCEAGFVVACPDVRLLFRGGPLTTQLDDVGAMRAFWAQQEGDLGLDPSRVSIAGLSAGGALALLHAASAPQVLYRVVGVYGLYDFHGVRGPGATLIRRQLLGTGDADGWTRASPLARVRDIDAPLLLVHGTADQLVPLEQAEAVVAARGDRPTELARFEGMRHGWLQDPERAESAQLVDRVVGFLSPDPDPG